jgi:hypothetical protein
MDQMDQALAAGDTERFRALKEAAQGVEKDVSVGLGNYYSGGNEPSEAYFGEAGVGIPTTLVSEKELDEIVQQYGSNFAGMATALVQKYPDLAPYLGGALGAQAVGAGTLAIGGAVGAGAGEALKMFLTENGSANAAKKFNQLRLKQARIRIANAGQRLQGEMRTREGEYKAATGQDFRYTYPEGWGDTDFGGGPDPSDPSGW